MSDSSRPKPLRVEVVTVIDGDTVNVWSATGQSLGRVGLLGIVTPELAYDGRARRCFAENARQLLRRLIGRSEVIVVTADALGPDRDRYGRLLRDVDVGGVDVAEALLTAGAARRYPGTLERGNTYGDAPL